MIISEPGVHMARDAGGRHMVVGDRVGEAFDWLGGPQVAPDGRVAPALATSYAYVNPVLAVLIGAALGGEPLGPSTVAATGLIVGAVVLVARGRSGGSPGR